ncbi:DNA-binding transcriptional regulator [Jannaschia pagri]|uniref:DNA-binding transcriptional regulator n=1 Tax=Jannaschia pagri TaxID=2829797 RepID=A0ABQ4NMU3_9RHOB|nr:MULTISPECIES: YafY family protein [unclassified Jannaschia]GIT91870.1 DNA-binding transcriptional regulator [Jannaschia sp. AI_61]GIT95704.1 DNA-binding transcriptional regulator [Jannaschia sp. AI_62]
MRRADRLFRLVQLMRGGKLWTAARLAEAMEVSERTVYRDVADLMASGVPIEGAAGVGYMMRDGYDLPPLMFTEQEVAALALGARMVVAWGGPQMAAGAREALSKIEAVLPDPEVVSAALARVVAPPVGMSREDRDRLDVLDRQVRDGLVTTLDYVDASGASTLRVVHPLGLWFWGRRWTLVAWCELRQDFRMFRLDRMVSVLPSEQPFPRRPDRTLKACVAAMEAKEGASFPPEMIS